MTNAMDSDRVDVDLDEYIGCKQVVTLFAQRPSLKTVYNWMTLGVKCRATGTMVILQTEAIGGRRYTTKRWVLEFNKKLSRR